MFAIGATSLGILFATLEDKGAGAGNSDGFWRVYALTTVVVGLLAMAYSVKKLLNPKFDTSVNLGRKSPLFIPLIGVTVLVLALIPDDGSGAALTTGFVTGFFGGVSLVYGFDALTNRLSKGRSWRIGKADA